MAKKENTREIARRYAKALFELAEAAGEIKEISTDLAKLEILFENADLRLALSSPIVSQEEKLSAVYDLTKMLTLGAITQNFLLVVTKNGRVDAIDEIISEFRDVMTAETEEVAATLITASEVEDVMVEDLRVQISKKMGKKVTFTQKIDPKLIGGLIVQVGSTIYDYSVKSRINKMKQELAKAS